MDKDYKSIPHLRELLKDNDRNDKFKVKLENLVLDYSHTKLDQSMLNKLLEIYKEKNVSEKFESMFSGKIMNQTESRKVLHVALRNSSFEKYNEVEEVLTKISNFTDAIRSGKMLGFTGKKLKNFISIGIGGSYLGADFVYNALKDHPECQKLSEGLTLRFLANVCPIDFKRATDNLNPEETLVIIISKTFTTKETILNAETVKNWLLTTYPDSNEKNYSSILSKHLCAVSTNLEATSKFGIENENVFEFWDWVGGRYSVWSAVGAVPLSLIFSFNIFRKFLDGGKNIDNHLVENLKNPLNNLPIMLGLLGYYNVTIGNISSRAILPYSQALNKFASHIQQLDMESNGKQVSNITNEFLTTSTGPIVFGEPGTNGQHSFYQLIHQGRDVACEFIGYCNSQCEVKLKSEKISNHEELMSNFFAQPDALALGLFKEEIKCSDEKLINHKVFKGDKSSLCLLFKELDAFSCGQLLSIYEHRVATEGFLYEVNSFDQFGVELGKVNAGAVRKIFEMKNDNENINLKEKLTSFNSSTSSLIQDFYKMRTNNK